MYSVARREDRERHYVPIARGSRTIYRKDTMRGKDMQRSVLIIDTPENCTKCNYGGCPAWDDTKEIRPEGCPLRPLPMPEVCNPYSFEGYENGRAAGFNRCLELIGGKV